MALHSFEIALHITCLFVLSLMAKLNLLAQSNRQRLHSSMTYLLAKSKIVCLSLECSTTDHDQSPNKCICCRNADFRGCCSISCQQLHDTVKSVHHQPRCINAADNSIPGMLSNASSRTQGRLMCKPVQKYRLWLPAVKCSGCQLYTRGIVVHTCVLLDSPDLL